jgi:membrane-bound lytic murein transglycosylase D
MLIKSITYLTMMTLLASCATSHNRQKKAQGDVVELRTVEDIIAKEKSSQVKKKLAHNTKSASSTKSKSLELNYQQKHFKFWKKYFSKREEARFIRHLNNGLRFKSIVDRVFTEHGLPKDLFYVGLIESGYNTHIKSKASAVGPWQFIKGTATRYGLRVDGSVDERRSIYKASVAAAGYFRDLYNIFGSWELALCAYNAGEYRIIRAIRRGNTRDYVELVEKKLIPKETIMYVPKVAAAKYLIETKYKNMMSSNEEGFYNKTKSIALSKSFSAEQVRKTLKISRKSFKLLNPDLKRDWIKNRKKFVINVPLSTGHSYIAKLDHIKSNAPKRSTSKKVRSIASKSKWYKVKPGQSLSTIAHRHKLSVKDLKSFNGLRNNKIFPGQKLIVSESTRRAPTQVKASKKSFYTVKKGDYLGKIARRFKLSLSELKNLNGLRKSALRVGQRLQILKDQAISKLYIVRKGDSLYAIARRFGVSVSRLVKANSLARKTIYPRQKIIIPLNS